MSADGEDIPARTESYLDRLEACDEALAHGRPPPDLGGHPTGDDEMLDVLQRLAGLRAPANPGEAADPDDATSRLLEPPRSFGDYELIEPIASGGMGVVYRARQRSLNRVVAVKMIALGPLADAGDLRRFRFEAESIARLDHPHIVPIYEVGQAGDRPFFSMKLMEGGSLQDRVGRSADDPRAAARLVVAIAAAVHHAHQHGILHRDLKPANVLLDAQGIPYVCDFGLARAREGDSSLTQSGAILGTPSFMSPEQADGRRAVTMASDVYGLGAILFALVTGRPPFQAATPVETLRRVIDEEPPAPRVLNPRIDRDLEAICLKALDKRPRRRYSSASALAEDLEDWLAGRPIRARRIGRAERVWKWAGRHPTVAGLSLVLVLVAATGLIGMFALYRQADSARRHADNQADRALAALESSEASLYVNRMALADRYRATHDADRADELLDECPEALRGWEWRYLKRHLVEDVTTYPGHDVDLLSVAISPDGRYLVSADHAPDIHVRDRNTSRVLELPGFAGGGTAVAFSPDGHWMAAGGAVGASGAGSIKLWSRDTWAEVRTLGYDGTRPRALAFSPDGRRLVAGHDTPDDSVRLWDVATGAVRTLHGHKKHVTDVAFSPDPAGRLIASASRDETIRIWDAETGVTRAIIRHDRPVYSLSFHPEGRLLAAATGDYWDTSRGDLVLWDLDSMRVVRKASRLASSLVQVRFSPDGRRLATAGWDRLVRIWDAETLHDILSLPGPTLRIWCLAFSRDGHQLICAAGDGVVRCWDAAPLDEQAVHRPLRTFAGHHQAIYALAVTPDGRRLVSAGEDRTARVWEIETGRNAITYRGHRQSILSLAIRPDSQAVASGGDDQVIRIWDPRTGADLRRLTGHTWTVTALRFHPDGIQLASASEDRSVRLWDTHTGELIHQFTDPTSQLFAVGISSDGHRLAAAGESGEIYLWDLGDRRLLSVLRGHTERIVELAFHPSDLRLLSASVDGTVRLWEPDFREFRAYDGVRGRGLAWNPDGRHFVMSGAGGTLKVWEAFSGRRTLTLRGHDDDITRAVFTTDGLRIATASWDHTIRLWETSRDRPDLSSGESLRLDGHPALASHVTVLPDGRRAISVGFDRSIREWDLAAGRELRRWAVPDTFIYAVEVTPDGRRLVVDCEDTGIRTWDLESGRELRRFDRHRGAIFSLSVTPDSRSVLTAGPLVLKPGEWATGPDVDLRLWDLETGAEVRRLAGHKGGVWSVAISRDGRRAASASMDGTVRAWDLEAGREICRFEGPEGYRATAVDFLPDGRHVLFGGSDRRLRLWDVESGQEVLHLDGHQGSVHHLAVSPDGRRALSSGDDHQLSLWDLATGRELYHYEIPHIGLTRGTFTRDGRRAIWGAWDGSVRIWDLPSRFTGEAVPSTNP